MVERSRKGLLDRAHALDQRRIGELLEAGELIQLVVKGGKLTQKLVVLVGQRWTLCLLQDRPDCFLKGDCLLVTDFVVRRSLHDIRDAGGVLGASQDFSDQQVSFVAVSFRRFGAGHVIAKQRIEPGVPSARVPGLRRFCGCCGGKLVSAPPVLQVFANQRRSDGEIKQMKPYL